MSETMRWLTKQGLRFDDSTMRFKYYLADGTMVGFINEDMPAQAMLAWYTEIGRRYCGVLYERYI